MWLNTLLNINFIFAQKPSEVPNNLVLHIIRLKTKQTQLTWLFINKRGRFHSACSRFHRRNVNVIIVDVLAAYTVIKTSQ